MPPPPPPPPAPPPAPKQPIGASRTSGKTNNFDPPADRNALLSQIRKGARLKKAETNDKSAPLIDAKRSTPGDAVKRPADTKSNGPFPIIPPGGLFAQGIPKLRPTTPRSGDTSGPSSLTIQSIKSSGLGNSSLDHLRMGQLSRSQPPSPVSKPRMSPTSHHRNPEATSGNPNFPEDINLKGPAPAPPPASQKPSFNNNKPSDQQRPAATVKRSASQTNLGQRPRINRPPPNVKPPPPPKGSPAASNPTPPQSAPPPPPSKPPNILRRQSFGVGETHASRFAANKLSVAANGTNKLTVGGPKTAGPPPPPPPPRNNSVPNELNQIAAGSSSPNQWSKMNIAPPPPPPNRTAVGRAAPIRPPPPRAPAPPPPPPQHHFGSHPAPPSQLKATLSCASSAPPPPTRVSSMKQASDFEDRFKFHPAQTLPKPDRFTNAPKNYRSKANHSRQKQNTRRLPPPPPPQTGNSSGQSVLHIQLNSGIFSSNNFAHS